MVSDAIAEPLTLARPAALCHLTQIKNLSRIAPFKATLECPAKDQNPDVNGFPRWVTILYISDYQYAEPTGKRETLPLTPPAAFHVT